MDKLTLQADKFELPENIHYLNGAFMSPQLKSVTEAGLAGVRAKAHPYTLAVDDFFSGPANIRQAFSSLINNPEPNRIALIPSVSYGMATVTHNVNLRGKEVVVAGEQFPSNVYPWMSATARQGGKLVTVEPPAGEGRGARWNQLLIEAITTRTALVAISQVHWADGTLFDLAAIRERTREVGALLIVDGTQSVGAYPFDILKIQPDALICAGYKWLLGAYGLGVAWYGDYFTGGLPIEENWLNRLNSEDFAGLVAYEEAYQPGALRFGMGEQSNFVLVPMLLQGLRQLNEWTPGRIQEYCTDITEGPLKELQAAGFWVEDKHWRASHLFGIRHEAMPAAKIKNALTAKNIYVSYRGNAIRVSPYVHNSVADMQALADVLVKSI